MSEEKLCAVCGKPEPCEEWDCRVEECRRAGLPEFRPNNLPVRCIRADGLMLEDAHGDHPDYIFPVDVEYVGTKDEERYQWVSDEGTVVDTMDADWRYVQDHEDHALIYASESVAVTIYETCSVMWSLNSHPKFIEGKRVEGVRGLCLGGQQLWEKGQWRLTDESLQKIEAYVKAKREGQKVL